jgi:hypothetical protein
MPLRLAMTGTSTSRGCAFEQAQVAAWPGVVVGVCGEVGQRLGEAVGSGVGQPGVAGGLAAQLFLEQRVEHHCADAGVGEARTPSTVCDSGEAEAISGLRRARPM